MVSSQIKLEASLHFLPIVTPFIELSLSVHFKFQTDFAPVGFPCLTHVAVPLPTMALTPTMNASHPQSRLSITTASGIEVVDASLVVDGGAAVLIGTVVEGGAVIVIAS